MPLLKYTGNLVKIQLNRCKVVFCAMERFCAMEIVALNEILEIIF